MQLPDYDPAVPAAPLDDAELDALDALLGALGGERAMNVEAIDGYLTALLLGPRLAHALPAARWLPPVWGAGSDDASAAPFASGRQKKRVVVLVLRHLRALESMLDGPPDAWEPVFSIAETDEGEILDAEDWCVGFLLGAGLDAAAWAPHWDDALLAPLVRLGADETPIDDPVERDAVGRAAADAVAVLAARRRSESALDQPRT